MHSQEGKKLWLTIARADGYRCYASSQASRHKRPIKRHRWVLGRAPAELVKMCKKREVHNGKWDVPEKSANVVTMLEDCWLQRMDPKQEQDLFWPHQRGSEPTVQSSDSLRPQQLPGDLRGRHLHGFRPRAGVVRTTENGAGSTNLQRCYNTGQHPLLGS